MARAVCWIKMVCKGLFLGYLWRGYCCSDYLPIIMIPRVTEVLRAYTNYEHVSQAILDKASSRGSKVHSICAGIAKGAWIPEGMIDEAHVGYVSSFKQWSESQVSKFVIVEKRFTNEEYSGQVDFVIKGSDSNLYLVDIKTSAAPQKTHPVQMSAYENLLRQHDIRVHGAMLVYLSKSGEFPDIKYYEDLTEELNVFKGALFCWKFFNKRKDKTIGKTKHISKNPLCNEGLGLHREGDCEGQRPVSICESRSSHCSSAPSSSEAPPYHHPNHSGYDTG